ncbi:MAG: hypothetical protein REI12_07740 [Pedobacter sp.]|nr:hypothetical protein [Pedobacter sp.]
MQKLMLPVLLLGCIASASALADTCLNTDKEKYADNDVRSFDYGKCKPAAGAPDNSYNSLNAIGKQMQGIMERSNESGYSDAQREANLREIRAMDAKIKAYQNEQAAKRSQIKYGASIEKSGIDYSKYQYQNANISIENQQAIRQEIGAAITSGKLLETYGNTNYADVATWKNATDPAQRWKNCEVATQLVRAYVFGDFIKPEQKDPAKGYAIAKTGRYQSCGGTGYWLGRILEAGNPLVPGVDKDENEINGGKGVKYAIESAYNIAILNSYTPAYERMAEMYRLAGPKRFRGKTYFVMADFDSYPYWSDYGWSNEMYPMQFQYNKCLALDPANLICARGLASTYSDKRKDRTDDYTNYNPELAAYYTKYAKDLESKLTAAGLPLPAVTP